MLQKERSNQTAMMKYGLIAPLFMLMIVVSSATLASKELTKIEEKVEQFSEQHLEEVIVKPSKAEILSDANLDLSEALIISPSLVDEVRAMQKSKIDTIKPVKQSTEVFDNVEQNAEYPGGMDAFGKYLQENLKYPEAAQKANITGKIYTEFIVNTDGSVSDFKTLKGIGFGCDEEAIRVLQMAKWNPGKQSGRIVRSKLVVPILFQLAKENKIEINKKNNEEFPKLPAVIEPSNTEATVFNSRIVTIWDKEHKALEGSKKPIYMMKGKKVSEFELNGIDPKDIEILQMYKGETAIMRYGEEAKNGAIVITLKKK